MSFGGDDVILGVSCFLYLLGLVIVSFYFKFLKVMSCNIKNF